MTDERLHIDGLDEQLPEQLLVEIETHAKGVLIRSGNYTEDTIVTWEAVDE